MPKKEKIPAILISSREGMIATVNQVVADKLQFAAVTVKMEQEIIAIQEKYQAELTSLARGIQAGEAGVQLYCEQNRTALFPDKKSIDLTLAIVGFRETPYRVEKTKSKDTWEDIAARMSVLRTDDGKGHITFNGEDYITYPDPDLSKKLLLQDRTKLSDEILKAAGIKFAYDENFFIEPKSEVAAASVKEAA
jgi:phage host-nuclease inhibitor protein Gam